MFHIILRQTMHSDHRHSPWRVASIRGVRMVVVFLHSQYDIPGCVPPNERLKLTVRYCFSIPPSLLPPTHLTT